MEKLYSDDIDKLKNFNINRIDPKNSYDVFKNVLNNMKNIILKQEDRIKELEKKS